MTHRFCHQISFVVALLIALSPMTLRAQEDSKQACIQAYEAAQELKLDNKLVEASERATSCAQQRCPEVIRSDCTKWAVELREAVPTIVVVAKGEAGDLSDVRVYVDDALAAETLTGEPIAIDPGRHKLRFEHGDTTPVEQELLIAVGVRNRTIEVTFGVEPADATADRKADGSADEEGELPVAGIALVGLGVASVVVFAALAAVGTSEIDDLRASCGQTQSCAEGDVDDAKTKIIVGDVMLGVGVLAAGIGAALIIVHYVAGDDASESAVRWGVAPTVDGAAGALQVRF
jgi:hypothetical protein